ncbi:MAG: thiamine pyrophosphate-dependent enzyme [Gammaproteobacteria bacterium]|nr:thiamine pyrophosphate-dependent enzyme [Gammaproteobacteria bacterium]
MDDTVKLNRREVASALLTARGDALLVTGLGSTCWDAAAVGDEAGNFYLWGAMGGAAMIGLGLALAQPQRRVLVLTGDGEMLMGLGAFASIAVQQPHNLALVVIDNERYGETGMQATHTHFGVDLAGVARAAGFAHHATVVDEAGLRDCIPVLFGELRGPAFVAVKVDDTPVPMILPPRDGTFLKNRFRDHVGV